MNGSALQKWRVHSNIGIIHLIRDFYCLWHMCFVQIDSVAEEVERQKSRTDMVIFKWLESYLTFLEDEMMIQDSGYSSVRLLVGIYLWRCRSTAFRCYLSRHCKSFWCSFGALLPSTVIFLQFEAILIIL